MLHIVFRRSRKVGLAVLLFIVLMIAAGTGIVLTAGAQSAGVQSAPSSTFVVLRGTDTIGVETVTIDAALIKGTLAMRGQPKMEWEQAFDNRVPGQLTMRVYAPGAAAGAAPLQEVVFAVRGDSARIEQVAGGKSATTMMAVKPGTVVIIGTSVLHASFIANYARGAGKTAVSALNAAGGQMLDASIATSGDTTTFTIAGLPIRTVWRAGSPQLITVAPQGIRAVLTTASIAPPSSMPTRIDYGAPANAPYTAEQVSIPTSRGYTLAATLTKPKGLARVPVVITISGSGPQERDSRLAPVPGYAIFREVADTLGKRGIAVLRYDDRGVGESGGRSSAATATSADFADDVRSVIEWLRTRPDIDGARIAVAGHSEGGLIAPLVASTDARIRAVALLAGPAYSGRRVLMFQNELGIRSLTTVTEAQRDSLRRTVPGALDSLARANPWFNYFINTDPAVALRKVKQPVLVLQGNTDMQVSPEQADTLSFILRKAGNTRVTVQRFPDTNHLFLRDPVGVAGGYSALKDPTVRRDVLGALANFMVTALK
jgi:pimeloyl-ACP methyl ester carboxylesterase